MKTRGTKSDEGGGRKEGWRKGKKDEVEKMKVSRGTKAVRWKTKDSKWRASRVTKKERRGEGGFGSLFDYFLFFFFSFFANRLSRLTMRAEIYTLFGFGFLVAYTRLSKLLWGSVRSSVRPSVRPSVGPVLFLNGQKRFLRSERLQMTNNNNNNDDDND